MDKVEYCYIVSGGSNGLMVGMVEKIFAIYSPQPFLSSFVFGIAPIWGCLFYSHKSIGSEGLSLASLAGKRLVLGVCLLKGRGISR